MQRYLFAICLIPCSLEAFQPDPQALRHLYEQALAKRELAYGLASAQTASAARDLGLYLLDWANDRAGAQQALANALAIDEKALGPTHLQTLTDAAELAGLSSPEEAASLWTRASRASDYALAARAYAALADLREAAGDRSTAKQLFQAALEKEEAAQGKNGAGIAVRLNSLALVSDPSPAVTLLQRALAIDRSVWGEKHPETATTQVNLSGELLAAGRINESVQMGKLALLNFEATLGSDHPRTGAAASTLADALRAGKNTVAAEKLYRRALAIDQAAYGPNHPETLQDVRTLAAFLRELGRTEEAAQLEKLFNVSGR